MGVIPEKQAGLCVQAGTPHTHGGDSVTDVGTNRSAKVLPIHMGEFIKDGMKMPDRISRCVSFNGQCTSS